MRTKIDVVHQDDETVKVTLHCSMSALEKGVGKLLGGVPNFPVVAFQKYLYGQFTGTSYELRLLDVGEKKIHVIKAVRAINQSGLKETKELCDKVQARRPQVVEEFDLYSEAQAHAKVLEEAGAAIDIQEVF